MAIKSWEFDYLRRIVKERSGIVLEDGKEYLVESRLNQLIAKEKDVGTIGDLIALLRTNASDPIVHRIVDAMTTNETLFFRDPQVFEALKSRIFPDLIKARSSLKELSIWCAAASSGQESYSVLMLLAENFPSLRDWKFRFLTTDISPTMLDRTRGGIYTNLEVGRGLLPGYKEKYFASYHGSWQVKKQLRDQLELKELNLCGAWPEIGKFDLVLIRNVLIYFDVAAKKDILRKVRSVMRSDAYCLLGAGESTLGLDDNFERVQVDKIQAYRQRDEKNQRKVG